MRPDIHPNYQPVVFMDTTTGYKFLSGSTKTSNETVEWEDGNTTRQFVCLLADPPLGLPKQVGWGASASQHQRQSDWSPHPSADGHYSRPPTTRS